jgi:hypothetical protein
MRAEDVGLSVTGVGLRSRGRGRVPGVYTRAPPMPARTRLVGFTLFRPFRRRGFRPHTDNIETVAR